MVAHHAVTDGWSARLLLRELAAHYARAVGAADDRAALPALPVQFADFAVWERGRLRGQVLDELAGWWASRRTGRRPFSSPPTTRAPGGGFAAASPARADRRPRRRLREPCRGEGTTLFMTAAGGLRPCSTATPARSG